LPSQTEKVDEEGGQENPPFVLFLSDFLAGSRSLVSTKKKHSLQVAEFELFF